MALIDPPYDLSDESPLLIHKLVNRSNGLRNTFSYRNLPFSGRISLEKGRATHLDQVGLCHCGKLKSDGMRQNRGSIIVHPAVSVYLSLVFESLAFSRVCA